MCHGGRACGGGYRRNRTTGSYEEKEKMRAGVVSARGQRRRQGGVNGAGRCRATPSSTIPHDPFSPCQTSICGMTRKS